MLINERELKSKRSTTTESEMVLNSLFMAYVTYTAAPSRIESLSPTTFATLYYL